jgi:hypothetical protein
MNEKYKNGYCLTYCVAKILGLEVEKVPYFAAFEFNWLKALKLFLHVHNYTAEVTPFKGDNKELLQRSRCSYKIGVIKIECDTDTHAIILNNDLSLRYDPNAKDNLTINYKKEDLLYVILIDQIKD